MERIRNSTYLNKMVLPTVEKIRMQARAVDPNILLEKINPQWLLTKGMEKYPRLVEVIKRKGDAGQIWTTLVCQEACLYLTGRLIWSPAHNNMVLLVEPAKQKRLTV